MRIVDEERVGRQLKRSCKCGFSRRSARFEGRWSETGRGAQPWTGWAVGGVVRFGLQQDDDELLDVGVAHRPRSAGSGFVGEAFEAMRGKTHPPGDHRRTRDFQLGGDDKFDSLSAAARTIQLRVASPAAVVCRRAQDDSWFPSASNSVISGGFGPRTPAMAP